MLKIADFLLGCLALAFIPEVLADSIQSRIEQAIQPLVDESQAIERRYVGVSVGIIVGGEKRFFGFGKKSLDLNEIPTSDTIYEIGSVTKAFTGILLADAVVRGCVKLDTYC